MWFYRWKKKLNFHLFTGWIFSEGCILVVMNLLPPQYRWTMCKTSNKWNFITEIHEYSSLFYSKIKLVVFTLLCYVFTWISSAFNLNLLAIYWKMAFYITPRVFSSSFCSSKKKEILFYKKKIKKKIDKYEINRNNSLVFFFMKTIIVLTFIF